MAGDPRRRCLDVRQRGMQSREDRPRRSHPSRRRKRRPAARSASRMAAMSSSDERLMVDVIAMMLRVGAPSQEGCAMALRFGILGTAAIGERESSPPALFNTHTLHRRVWFPTTAISFVGLPVGSIRSWTFGCSAHQFDWIVAEQLRSGVGDQVLVFELDTFATGARADVTL